MSHILCPDNFIGAAASRDFSGFSKSVVSFLKSQKKGPKPGGPIKLSGHKMWDINYDVITDISNHVFRVRSTSAIFGDVITEISNHDFWVRSTSVIFWVQSTSVIFGDVIINVPHFMSGQFYWGAGLK